MADPSTFNLFEDNSIVLFNDCDKYEHAVENNHWTQNKLNTSITCFIPDDSQDEVMKNLKLGNNYFQDLEISASSLNLVSTPIQNLIPDDSEDELIQKFNFNGTDIEDPDIPSTSKLSGNKNVFNNYQQTITQAMQLINKVSPIKKKIGYIG